MIDFAYYDCDDLQSFFEFCRKIEYGWLDEAGGRHLGVNNIPGYSLQTPMELLESKLGTCWDQTELQRAWFTEHNYQCETYFLYYYLNDDCCPSHSILVYRDQGEVCWFEPTFYNTAFYYSGIHRARDLDEIMARFWTRFVRNGQMSGFLPKEFQFENLELYRYSQPQYHISDKEFYDHCRRGERISLKR